VDSNYKEIIKLALVLERITIVLINNRLYGENENLEQFGNIFNAL